MKRCCLDEHVAWRRAGNGIMVAYVDRGGGVRYPIVDWGASIDARSEIIIQLNPVTSAWAYRALPDVKDFGSAAYRTQLFEHLMALSDGELSAEHAEALADELCAARECLTIELTLVPAA